MVVATAYYSRCLNIPTRVRIVVVHGVPWRACIDAHRAIEDLKPDALLLCGGLHECYTLYHISTPIPMLAGVNALGDDIYEIKALKLRDAYAAGRWICTHVHGSKLCIGGVDALNHSQNVDKLIASAPRDIDLAILLSYYPPRESVCSVIELANRFRISIGIPQLDKRLRSVLTSVPLLLISCHPRLRPLCIERERGYIHISLGPTPLIAMEVEVLRGDVELRDVRVVEAVSSSIYTR
ncbi:MAG TPA: hypothetical protein EYH02_03090 [Ignisphaera aggregans]|uniref:Metallophosphoesterase n=1 Tax=Ignisphaera aggregans TaxID=334771 RepID=A0A833DT81_9CREN|nr:hypothetical protein [Ignisphaera aggregans]